MFAGLMVALAILAVVCLVSLAVGAKSIPLGTVTDALTDYDSTIEDHLIVHTLRIPRTLVGLMVGVAIGLVGAMLQGLTRNPLADPGILGLEAGAALTAVLAVFLLGVASVSGYVWFAFVGVAIAGVMVYGIGSIGRDGATPVKLTIAGAALAALFSSFTAMIMLRDIFTTLNTIRFWLVGSIGGQDINVVYQSLPFIAVGSLMALSSGRLLNTLSLGEDVARSLGQHVGRVRVYVGASIVLLTGAAVAAAGPIVFVGLVIPHLARAITGPDYRWILPYSAVLAPILLLGSDIIGRVVLRPEELEVGIVTAFIGAPFFIALVRRRKLAEL